MTIKIDMLHAYCGAGKTFAMARKANKMALAGQKVMLVQLTADLINETMTTTFPKVGVTAPHRAITTASDPYAVRSAIKAAMADTTTGGEIILVTHAAFLGMHDFPQKRHWTIMMDEIPEISDQFSLDIPDSHTILTDHMTIARDSLTKYRRVIDFTDNMLTIADNPNKDQVFKHFQPFARCVVSKLWDVHVNGAPYDDLVKSKQVFGINRKLLASAVMLPTSLKGFKKVLIAGACFEQSLLYNIWSNLDNHKVEFADVSEDYPLKYRTHANSDLITIYWFTKERWSKSFRDSDRLLADGVTMKNVMAAIDEKVRGLVGGEAMVIHTNKDQVGHEDRYVDCVRLPNKSQGLNTYQHIDHCALFSALNPIPAHFAFLQEFANFDGEQVQNAVSRQAAYQAANRTSIRDLNNTSRKKWFVPDEATALWLKTLYPNAKVVTIPTFADAGMGKRAGRPREHENDTTKKQKSRARCKARDEERRMRKVRLDFVNGTGFSNNVARHLGTINGVAATELKNIAVTGLCKDFQASFFLDTEDTEAVLQDESFDGMVSFLMRHFEDKHERKEECWLLSVSRYSKGRKKENFAFARNIVLDFDGGDLTPAAFLELFPDWRMVTYSTWSNSADNIRWRALIETDLAMDFDSYCVITRSIVKRLNDAGYHSEKQLAATPKLAKDRKTKGIHGIDEGKLTPTNLMYMPTKGENPEAAFVVDHKEGRTALDFFAVLMAAPVPEPVPAATVQPTVVPPAISPYASPKIKKMATTLRNKSNGKAAKIKDAEDFWNNECDFPGKRNTGAYRYAMKLKAAGCDQNEAKSIAQSTIRDRKALSDAERAIDTRWS